jgi:hypothetical protein
MAKDMMQPERIKAVENKRHIARVVSVDDSERLLRVQVRVFVMHPESLTDKECPWAEFAPPPGNRDNAGTFIPVEPGDYVWVDFPYDGDVRRPRLLGSVHYAPDSEPYFPHEAWLGPDAVEHKREEWEPMPSEREYFKQGAISHKGIVIEFVEDSVIVTQRETGTAIEITPEGDLTLHGEKNVYISAQENIRIHAKQNIVIDALNVTVSGAISCMLAGGTASIFLANSGGECSGHFHFDGSIDADGSIMDAAGNTNHHTHG